MESETGVTNAAGIAAVDGVGIYEDFEHSNFIAAQRTIVARRGTYASTKQQTGDGGRNASGNVTLET